MDIGLLTSPFRTESMEQVAAFAGKTGFAALEVNARPGSAQLDPRRFGPEQADRIRTALDRNGLRISSLACYVNVLEPDSGKRQAVGELLRKTIDAAADLGVDVVCTLAGMPLPGKTKMQTIEQDLPGVLEPVLEYAGRKGIRIALENWFATNIQHLEHWRRLFELLPAENFGLNFDPSHLFWQQIDYLAAVEEFGTRIFHTHAKDCEVRAHVLRRVGVLERGWWRYVIPGFGGVDWGAFVGALHRVGYRGVLSIEHEDGAVGREEGFRLGLKHLGRFV
ncbi:MAG: sugar phosphate isomerase/epimerase [Kiritimatiellaeota bacterium]|nr:sugar phosphate isomerase/epimerase [Kiritimatiellota bacterium]